MRRTIQIIVLFTIFLTGCMYNTPSYVRPSYPLSDIELSSLSATERAFIEPSGNLSIRYFPEAVVYEKTEYTGNDEYQKYEKENSRPLPDGTTEMPTMTISVRTHDVFRSAQIIVRETIIKECIPGMDKCSSSVSQETVVFRDHPVDILKESLSLGSGNIIARTDDRSISMLELTKDTIRLVIVKAKEIRVSDPAEGNCEKLRWDGSHCYLDEPLDAKLVTHLTNADSEYLPYQEVDKIDEMLAEYEFARNGCYDNNLTKKLRAIERGESILNVIFGPPTTLL